MTYLLMVLKYLPLIMQLVETIEKLAGHLPGAEKKALVIQAIGDSVNGIAPGSLKPEDLSAVSHIIDTVATIGSAFGVFGKSKKA